MYGKHVFCPIFSSKEFFLFLYNELFKFTFLFGIFVFLIGHFVWACGSLSPIGSTYNTFNFCLNLVHTPIIKYTQLFKVGAVRLYSVVLDYIWFYFISTFVRMFNIFSILIWYRKDTEPLYHTFMYSLVSLLFPVSIHYLKCIHWLLHQTQEIYILC